MASPKILTGPITESISNSGSMAHHPIQAKRWEMEPGHAYQYNGCKNGQVDDDGSRCKPVLLHVTG